ncbi:hypothetical protein CVT25_004101 [Psilocybe cyanescens]|uniref:Uncharacterized protein n=1 Tax=Psilocybe cyanescens TaxID=93625 RepID=A0A409X954_PSICY|nr:hypothetical protein CVT25_004101 [Psilocybe cyanescens]
MKLHIPGEDHLNGFNDLLLKDMMRVVNDMGWKNVVKSSSMGIVNSPGPILTGPNQQSASESEDDTFENPPLRLETKIGAQHAGGWGNNSDAGSDIKSPVIASTTRVSHFEPIISFPDGPLPPLDFRFRTPALAPSQATVDISSKISSYRENPISIIGKKLRFNDGNRTWEVSEIVYDRKGWGSVTVEGEDESHKFDFEVLMSMLKHGVLDEV